MLRDEGSGVWNMRKVIVSIFKSLFYSPPPSPRGGEGHVLVREGFSHSRYLRYSFRPAVRLASPLPFPSPTHPSRQVSRIMKALIYHGA